MLITRRSQVRDLHGPPFVFIFMIRFHLYFFISCNLFFFLGSFIVRDLYFTYLCFLFWELLVFSCLVSFIYSSLFLAFVFFLQLVFVSYISSRQSLFFFSVLFCFISRHDNGQQGTETSTTTYQQLNLKEEQRQMRCILVSAHLSHVVRRQPTIRPGRCVDRLVQRR